MSSSAAKQVLFPTGRPVYPKRRGKVVDYEKCLNLCCPHFAYVADQNQNRERIGFPQRSADHCHPIYSN